MANTWRAHKGCAYNQLQMPEKKKKRRSPDTPSGAGDGDTLSTTLRVGLAPGPNDGQQVACLVLISGPQLGQVFVLKNEEVRIGRAVDAEFCIRDPAISHYHAKVVPNGRGGYNILDLNSTNGTY